MSGFFVCVFTEPGNGTTHTHTFSLRIQKCCPPPPYPTHTPYVSWRNIRFCHTTNEWRYRTTYTMSPLVFSLLKIESWWYLYKVKVCVGDFLNNPGVNPRREGGGNKTKGITFHSLKEKEKNNRMSIIILSRIYEGLVQP